jgi:signal transduction histidine kinase
VTSSALICSDTIRYHAEGMTPQMQNEPDLARMIRAFLHDVRSPLGVAQGYAYLLSGDQLTADDRARALKGVSDALDRMSSLVEDVASWPTLHDESGAPTAASPQERQS